MLVAVGQENAFPWIERDIGIEFDEWDMPVVDEVTMQSTNPQVFFGGDAAFGPKNIIWAVAHGHQAAISIHQFCQGEDVRDRPPPLVNLMSQKMGIHEWSYDNDISLDLRFKVPHRDKAIALRDIKAEVELGFDDKLAFAEAQRCLNCDVQTVFTDNLCIECDACVDICPVDCISFTGNGEEAELRLRLSAPAHNETQDLYVSGAAEDRAGDGEGRGCLPALRPVCRTVPHWRVGYAALPDRCGTGGARMLQLAERVTGLQRVNDFVVKFANVNGSGSASANTLFAQVDPAHGRAGDAAQHLSRRNIQGLPTWYEVRVSEAGHLGARGGGVDLMVAMNPQTWDAGHRVHRAGRLPVLRQHQADAAVAVPRRHRRDRRAADRDHQQGLHRIAAAAVVQEHRLSRRAVGAAGHGRGRDREAAGASSSGAATS